MAEFPSAIFDLVDQGIAGLYDSDGLGVCMDQNHIRGTQTSCPDAAGLDGAKPECSSRS